VNTSKQRQAILDRHDEWLAGRVRAVADRLARAERVQTQDRRKRISVAIDRDMASTPFPSDYIEALVRASSLGRRKPPKPALWQIEKDWSGF
jgi:hypothetical protein